MCHVWDHSMGLCGIQHMPLWGTHRMSNTQAPTCMKAQGTPWVSQRVQLFKWFVFAVCCRGNSPDFNVWCERAQPCLDCQALSGSDGVMGLLKGTAQALERHSTCLLKGMAQALERYGTGS